MHCTFNGTFNASKGYELSCAGKQKLVIFMAKTGFPAYFLSLKKEWMI